MRWLPLLLLIPLAAGAIEVRQDVVADLENAAGPAQIIAGDIGTPTIGASGHSASVSLGGLPVLANDILRLDSGDDAWQVHVELVTESGWSVLESITLSLTDGILTEPQVVINLGVLTQSTGNPVDLPEITTDTEVRVVGLGTGDVSFDLVLTPDGGGAELRYRVDLTVS